MYLMIRGSSRGRYLFVGNRVAWRRAIGGHDRLRFAADGAMKHFALFACHFHDRMETIFPETMSTAGDHGKFVCMAFETNAAYVFCDRRIRTFALFMVLMFQ